MRYFSSGGHWLLSFLRHSSRRRSWDDGCISNFGTSTSARIPAGECRRGTASGCGLSCARCLPGEEFGRRAKDHPERAGGGSRDRADWRGRGGVWSVESGARGARRWQRWRGDVVGARRWNGLGRWFYGEKGGVSVNSSSSSMVMAHFTTDDSVSQVTDFYKSKMGENAVVVSTGDGTVLTSGKNDEDSLTVTVGSGNGDDADKTTIVIMHAKKG